MSEESTHASGKHLSVEFKSVDLSETRDVQRDLMQEHGRKLAEGQQGKKDVTTETPEVKQASQRTTPGAINFMANREAARGLVLENSKKDSPEMADVKQAVSLLETVLVGRYDGPESITRLKSSYEEAIKACQTYCTKKNSSRSVGKKRKAMVELVKNNMIMEYALISITEKRCKESGNFPKGGGYCTELLDVTKTNLSIDDEAKVLLSGKQVQFDNLSRGNGDEDSQEMKDVKKANKDLFNMLYNTSVQQGEADLLADMVKVEFASVITACDLYIKAKSGNPRSEDGKTRLAAIKELKARYEKEMHHIGGAIASLRKSGEDVSLAVAYMRINQNQLMFMGAVSAEDVKESKTETKTTAKSAEQVRTQTTTKPAQEVKTQTKASKKQDDDVDVEKELRAVYQNEVFLYLKKFLKDNGVTYNYEKDKRFSSGAVKDSLKKLKEDAEKNGVELTPMSDAEVYHGLLEVDVTDPGYKQHVEEMEKDIKAHYEISPAAYTALEMVLRMVGLRDKCLEAQRIKPQLDARVAQLASVVAAYDVPVPSDWVQDENQRYSNSCWAVSSMNLVNCFNVRHNPGKPRFNQRFVLKKDGNEPVRYNEQMKFNLYEHTMDPYYDEERRNVERFLHNPSVFMGNVRTVADRLMECTDHKAIVRSKRFNVFVDVELPRDVYEQRCELLKLEMLQSIHETLTETKSPVSVLRGNHYLTIVGIRGRDLICKNSATNTAANYNDTMSIDALFSMNQRNRTVEFVWLQELTQEAIDGIKTEFPKAQEAYEARREDFIEPGGQYDVSDYTHVDGCDIQRTDLDDIHGTNDIQTTAYVPKVLPAGLKF